MSDIRDLAAALGDDPRLGPELRLRQATVTAVAADWTVTIRLAGSLIDIPGVKTPNGYWPRVGDVVQCLQNGPDLMVLQHFGKNRVPWAWYKGPAVSVPAATWTQLPISAIGQYNDDVTNGGGGPYFTYNAPNTLTVNRDGVYKIIARTVFELGSGGIRYMRIRLIGGVWGTGYSPHGRINDQNTSSDSNELEQTAIQDLRAGEAVGIDGFSTAATTTRGNNTTDESMWTALQLQLISRW